LEQKKITPQEIHQSVSSFEQNITSTKLGDLRWLHGIGMPSSVLQSEAKDAIQGSNPYASSNTRNKSPSNYDLSPRRIQLNNELMNHANNHM
jgi:hypothetical protein